MGAGQSVPYHLRPNKAVDRELFLSLLVRMAPVLKLDAYRYISLGGPFLEDFRLVHARVGLQRMTCVESDEVVHRRQKFNVPVPGVECVHSTFDAYIDSQDLEDPLIVWFDYTEPEGWERQVQRFARDAASMPIGSILRITLNAEPSALGGGELGGNLQEDRLSVFRERFGRQAPNDVKPSDMRKSHFGRVILRVLELAVAKATTDVPDRSVAWALATHYADGQAMVTATLVICKPGDSPTKELLDSWEFRSSPNEPHLLDMPVLSTRERLTLEAAQDLRGSLAFDLPSSRMGDDPLAAFEKFYRIYPHFSRVEL